MKSVDIYRCNLVKEKTVEYNADSPTHAVEAFRALGIADSADEIFAIACCATNGSITGIHEVSHGTLDGSLISPREVFKRAMLNNARYIILCHNHPSGNTEPSKADIDVTKRLAKAGKLLDINVMDHLIITQENVVSLRQKGIL